MILDLDKPLQTRDGRPVTLITTAGREPWPLAGYVAGDSILKCWKANGAYQNDEREYAIDLFNTP